MVSLAWSHGRQSIIGFLWAPSWDRGTSTYHQLTQLGYLNTDNVSFTLVPIFLNGTTFDDDGDPVDTQVLLHGIVNTPSVYATDTLTYGPWAVTLSGRYNHTSLRQCGLSACLGGARQSHQQQRIPAVQSRSRLYL